MLDGDWSSDVCSSDLEIIRARVLANRETSTLFDVANLSRHLEDLYRQMRDEYLAGTMPQPRLANLDAYFEIGVALDHETREMGAVSDYEEFYRAQLARRHYHHPMAPDGRLWAGEEKVETSAPGKARPKAA
jgi:hypothetical protein